MLTNIVVKRSSCTDVFEEDRSNFKQSVIIEIWIKYMFVVIVPVKTVPNICEVCKST